MFYAIQSLTNHCTNYRRPVGKWSVSHAATKKNSSYTSDALHPEPPGRCRFYDNEVATISHRCWLVATAALLPIAVATAEIRQPTDDDAVVPPTNRRRRQFTAAFTIELIASRRRRRRRHCNGSTSIVNPVVITMQSQCNWCAEKTGIMWLQIGSTLLGRAVPRTPAFVGSNPN